MIATRRNCSVLLSFVAVCGTFGVLTVLAGCSNDKPTTTAPPQVTNGTVMPKAGAPNGPTPEMMQRDKENAARAAKANQEASAALKDYIEKQKK